MDDQTSAAWRTSSHSQSVNQCVEVADLDGGRGVRDSKDPTGPALVFGATQWSAFVTGVSAGDFG